MAASSSNRLCILFPPIVAAVLDAALTLHGQAGSYWSDAQPPEELNPLAHYLLSMSPTAFVAGFGLWLAALVGAMLLAPVRIARRISFVVFLAHLLGACSWIIQLDQGTMWAVLACVAARIVLQPVYFADHTPNCGA